MEISPACVSSGRALQRDIIAAVLDFSVQPRHDFGGRRARQERMSIIAKIQATLPILRATSKLPRFVPLPGQATCLCIEATSKLPRQPPKLCTGAAE
jgi:hypothetical protein